MYILFKSTFNTIMGFIHVNHGGRCQYANTKTIISCKLSRKMCCVQIILLNKNKTNIVKSNCEH
jgi:hypothetical protein